MKKASEYRQHAAECRLLANRMELGEHRTQLLEMAATWDKLANDRSELVLRHPELALEGEHHEEVGFEPRPADRGRGAAVSSSPEAGTPGGSGRNPTA